MPFEAQEALVDELSGPPDVFLSIDPWLVLRPDTLDPWRRVLSRVDAFFLSEDEMEITPEIAEALAARRPVVALETTLVTHGLPHPEGLRVAAELEAAVRENGACPATIGVLGGQIRVGLGAEDLERLALVPDVAKLNLGNLAAHVAAGRSGSTTVAATVLVAQRAGIGVFATGGIGGVHRDASATDDVSSDLTALARFPVAVVCAGAKAVLDLRRTVERLETLGVPVYGFRTGAFPAFYRRDSGLAVDAAFESMADLAAAVRSHLGLGIGSGIVVANPIPEEHEMPRERYETSLAQALADAEREGLRGRCSWRTPERSASLAEALSRA